MIFWPLKRMSAREYLLGTLRTREHVHLPPVGSCLFACVRFALDMLCVLAFYFEYYLKLSTLSGT